MLDGWRREASFQHSEGLTANVGEHAAGPPDSTAVCRARTGLEPSAATGTTVVSQVSTRSVSPTQRVVVHPEPARDAGDSHICTSMPDQHRTPAGRAGAAY